MPICWQDSDGESDTEEVPSRRSESVEREPERKSKPVTPEPETEPELTAEERQARMVDVIFKLRNVA